MDIPPPTRHERRRLQTRKILIETTLQLILEKGYDAVSIQDITDQADLGRGTFYIHFKDKDEVTWAMFQDMFQELEQQAHQQLDRNMPQVEYYGFLKIFHHAEKNRDLYRVMFGGKGSSMLTKRVQDYLAKALLNDIRNAPATPGVNFHLPEEIETQILTGVISRLLFWWLETPNSYTAEQMSAMIYEALYRIEAPKVQFIQPLEGDKKP
jgi:AcrR family transcriptional regulator